MNAGIRREKIVQRLEKAEAPVSATALAKELGVSRQIIVGDIALLRAAEHAITATPRGYVLERQESERGKRFTIACRHDKDQLRTELYTIVDYGGGVLDVIVEHPIYGQLAGKLQVFSRYDADQFCEKLDSNQAPPLCDLTGGIHLHTILCPDEETFHRIEQQLHNQGFLVKK